MARIEDQARSKHRIAIFFIASNAETDQKSLPQPFFIQIDISASPFQLSPDRN
ncbi:hypothetical protein [Sphingobium yanoikuyae]|uniref:hypothetical protein n=1 Tax=Sphingobium yanoikuyae TaxID=13690 RepID=UPI00345F0FAD